MVPFLSATPDLVRLNTKWQEQLKTQKERARRKLIVGNHQKTDNILENDEISDAVVTVMDPSYYSTNPSTNSRPILPVAAVFASSYPTQKGVAEEFTLNREQRAAFMIITSHLDGDKQFQTGILITQTKTT